jgi:Flp pilus assembly protein TadG
MTEFAIVLPIFLLAIVGIIEFGRAVTVQQMLINAAREGAREAMAIESTNAEVLAVVNDYLDSVDSFVRDAPGRQVTIVDTDGNAIDLATVAKHSGVVVQVAVPYDEVGIGISSFFTDSSIGAAVEMRKE